MAHLGRREFIGLLGGAAAWPRAARAQQPAMPVIGFLRGGDAASAGHILDAFRRGLNEAGLFEGRHVTIEYHYSDHQHDRLPALAADLARRQAAVIIANGIAALAAKHAAIRTPIVFVAGSDPVRTGLVESLSRPGGTFTGVVFTTVDLVAKQLGLLHQLVPTAAVIAVLRNPEMPDGNAEVRELEEAGRATDRQLLIVNVASERDFNAAFATIVQARAGALLVGRGPLFLRHRWQLVTLAARHQLPASYSTREYIEVGGLMSYSASQTDAYRRAGLYAARIIRGEKPGDLPVELSAKFELTINLGTAKGMGLEIPPTLLALADEVIE
jgi:putative ABC transport system substrate-binding protein